MNKKTVFMIVVVTILISIILNCLVTFVFITYVYQTPLKIDTGEISTPETTQTQSDLITIEGRLIGIAETEKELIIEAKKDYGIPYDIPNLLLVNERDEMRPQYYLMYDPDNSISEVLPYMASADVVDTYNGKCAIFHVQKPILNQPDDPNNMYSAIQIVNIVEIQLAQNDNCYIDYPAMNAADIEKKVYDVAEVKIKNNSRGVFDIGYDYSIVDMPYAKAVEMGYMDSSGLDLQEKPEYISVSLVAASGNILKLMEDVQSEDRLVTLSGSLQWGYAESMYMLVTNVR
jgi:hypothetical protein